jgi:hypothetical protein
MMAGMKGVAFAGAVHSRGAKLFLAGLTVLAFGALVYALDRPADSVLFLPAVLSLHDGQAWIPPPLGGALPTFLHTLAFALMTAALLGPGPRCAVQAAAGWAVINILFESAQHPLFVKALGVGMAGTFDPIDVLAASAGAATAFLSARKFGNYARGQI